jgi:hypothetical protein
MHIKSNLRYHFTSEISAVCVTFKTTHKLRTEELSKNVQSQIRHEVQRAVTEQRKQLDFCLLMRKF